MGENDPKLLKTEFPDNKWNSSSKDLAYSYEFFNCCDDYRKYVDNIKKEDFFGNLKNKCPDDNETEQTKEIINIFNFKKEN